MKTKLLYFLMCSIGLHILQAQSQFDRKKHQGAALGQPPKQRRGAQVIDGRKQSNLHRIAPKGNLKNTLANLAKQAKLSKPFDKVRTIHSPETGMPIFITTTPQGANASRLGVNYDKRQATYTYLTQLQTAVPSLDPEKFEIENVSGDNEGNTHVRLAQTFGGFKVYGAEVMVHLDAAGNGKVFNGNYYPINAASIKATLPVQAAINLAISDLSKKTKYTNLPQFHKDLLAYEGPEVLDTLLYQVPNTQSFTLAYQISVHPNVVEHWEYFIDAVQGNILHAYKTTCHAGPTTATATDLNGVSRTIHTYQESTSVYTMVDASKSMFNPNEGTGVIQTLDAKGTFGENFSTTEITSTNNVWNNRSAVSAHFNAGVAYDYFKKTHGRESIDNKGGTIYSIINAVDEDGSALDNAYWNGKAMFYGNGAVAFTPLAGSLDVAGHEMTHGVVQTSANLIYQGESGAINESMADIFGCMMDSTDWLLGEDIVKLSYFPSGALRSLRDPHNGGTGLGDGGWQPRHMNERYTGTQDNGGVHINSGIPNYAFYLYATALNSRHRASKVFYTALTDYLTKSSKFIDLRLAVIQSAKDLYGENSSAVTEAAKAFDAVGIVNGTGTNTQTKLPVNPGQEYLLLYNTDGSDDTGLYITNTNATAFQAISDKIVYNKPSISDNGQYTLYIGTDHRMYVIDSDPASNNDIILVQGDPIWSSVSLSKDGKMIAATTLDPDTSIHIFNWATGEEGIFKLYNPTFSDSIKAAGPVYADGLDWDYTGQYLVYDAFNQIKNTSGLNLEYWDINLIHVWDKAANDFGSGKIFKLISDLQPGESIGNPCFSKTDPNILAFDYEMIDGNTAAYYEVGVNLETNTMGIIAENQSLGWPSYNKTDTKLAFSVGYTSTDYDIAYTDLNPDKISSNATPMGMIPGGKWPIFYSLGERDIQLGMLDRNLVSNLQVRPNPTQRLLQLPEHLHIQELLIYDKLGHTLSNYTWDPSSHTIDVSQLPSDLYLIKIKDANQSYMAKFSKVD